MTTFEKKFGKDFLKGVVLKPGTYAFYGEEGTILYIGRAKNLRRRLSQYKNTKRLRKHRKMRKIVQHAATLKWTESTSHLEACVTELRLIQEHRPRFNIDAKYSFMYPLIGVKEGKDETLLCLTTHPEEFPEFHFYGAYRSRRVTGTAFFSLYKMLKFIYHPVSPKRLKKSTTAAHSYVVGLRKLPIAETSGIVELLSGTSNGVLEELTLKLLEKTTARVNKETVQEYLDALAKFFRWESRRLRRVMDRQGITNFPIAQEERDLVFLKDQVRD